MRDEHVRLLRLLQLASPALPVGAYSYSEGMEALVEAGTIDSHMALEAWLIRELRYGAVRIEVAVMVRAYNACQANDLAGLSRWNHWLTAARETEELRSQSLQMGRSLMRLLQDLHLLDRQIDKQTLTVLQQDRCHFAIAFAVAAVYWELTLSTTMLGYLHSWASNLTNAGVKLIPLGQTAGQQLLLNLQPAIEQAVDEILILQDDALSSCSWGLALASMAHETQYSRLFRS